MDKILVIDNPDGTSNCIPVNEGTTWRPIQYDSESRSLLLMPFDENQNEVLAGNGELTAISIDLSEEEGHVMDKVNLLKANLSQEEYAGIPGLAIDRLLYRFSQEKADSSIMSDRAMNFDFEGEFVQLLRKVF